MLPVFKCWYAVGILYLTSICPALNPTAGSTRKEWNHNVKIALPFHAINGTIYNMSDS